MTLVLTMMVRDEADIIAATIEHHLAQGVDHILVTDNGSVDGTLDILEDYAAAAPLTLMHEPEQRKQQGRVVTRMARMAHTELGADWVINGDADEFVRALDPGSTLADVFGRMPRELGAISVPVVNLVGPMARRGSGLRRLVMRDERSPEQLRAAGVIAHPTPNAIHIGAPDVEVAQGNHSTSIEVGGEVPAGLELEVLHLPWRSLAQLVRKTENMGRGYEASPELRPSPNHHGMRDWRRLQAGLLEAFIALRTPTGEELEGEGFVPEPWLREEVERLVGGAVLPERLRAVLDDTRDEVLDDAEVRRLRSTAAAVIPVEDVLYRQIASWQFEADALRHDRDGYASSYAEAMRRLEEESAALADARASLAAVEADRDRALATLLALRARLDANPLVRARRAARSLADRFARG
ncbi:glycosyltransferase family 2 protein [Agrococcus sp. HG114]|uniref:glycosyltransferase family 2 protein n=1 Tax=Agrococcus sp. HG114 TaxID=2969757 RepID=UPI00215A251B|nr:glycosyltransferase family 2 protein [Agrococcus sp. HG114]MCR8670416.1 glycosyltransferase family 2 protein [Agrococcus sp. HG114]